MISTHIQGIFSIIVLSVICLSSAVNLKMTTLFIKGERSGRCLAVKDAGVNNNDPAVIYDCFFDLGNVQWIVNLTDIFYENHIVYYYYKARHSGKCLTVNGGSSENGAIVNQYTCVGQSNQQWTLVYQHAREYYTLKNRNSGKCLAVQRGLTDNNSQVVQRDCGVGTSPNWQFNSVCDAFYSCA